MPKSVDRDPRIPGPATKPVEEPITPSEAREMIDPVLDPGPQPVDYGPAERHPMDRAATPMTPGPLAADDPWTRESASPDPFGLDQEADFWDESDMDDEFAAAQYDALYSDPSRRASSGRSWYGSDDRTDSGDDEPSLLGQGAEMIRRNPVGTGLVLAGLAMLATPRIERESVRRQVRQARDGASARFEGPRREAQSRLRHLRDRLSAGTEGMSEAARERVMAARRRALDMSQRSSGSMQAGAQRADSAVRANPLMSGALAAVAGAALGAALPRTMPEDRSFGAVSDRLMDEARAIYEEERARIVAGASAAADEVRTMAREAVRGTREGMPNGREAVERGQEALREGAGRVATAAKDAADGERDKASPEKETSRG